MSIWATWLSIEHPDDWQAGLEAIGIKSGIIGDDSEERELGSPIIYQGSHVLPEATDARGGLIDLAAVPGHVRYYREHPDGQEDEGLPPEPFLRMIVEESPATYRGRTPGEATVVLDRAQVAAFHATLEEWLERVPS